MKPSLLSNQQQLNVIKVALYMGVSAAVSYLVSVVTKQPDLFGPLTPVVNFVLVFLKQVFTAPEV